MKPSIILAGTAAAAALTAVFLINADSQKSYNNSYDFETEPVTQVTETRKLSGCEIRHQNLIIDKDGFQTDTLENATQKARTDFRNAVEKCDTDRRALAVGGILLGGIALSIASFVGFRGPRV